jgi:hypothetical protein
VLGGERERHVGIARVHQRRVVAVDEQVDVVVLAVAAAVEDQVRLRLPLILAANYSSG